MSERSIYASIDTGRRGDPIPGCDCMQCFGMCCVEREPGRVEGPKPAEKEEVVADARAKAKA